MHYLSLDTVIYRPDGLRDIVLCQYDDVMAELVEVKPSVQIQRESVIGSPWHAPGGKGQRLPADVFYGGAGIYDVRTRPCLGARPPGDAHPSPGGSRYLVVLLFPGTSGPDQILSRYGGSCPAFASHERSRSRRGRSEYGPPSGGHTPPRMEGKAWPPCRYPSL